MLQTKGKCSHWCHYPYPDWIKNGNHYYNLNFSICWAIVILIPLRSILALYNKRQNNITLIPLSSQPRSSTFTQERCTYTFSSWAYWVTSVFLFLVMKLGSHYKPWLKNDTSSSSYILNIFLILEFYKGIFNFLF